MTQGEKDYAERMSLNNFDNWNEITGFVPKLSSYYYEIQKVIMDAVDIGIRTVLGYGIDLRLYDEGFLSDEEKKELEKSLEPKK